MTTFRSLGDFSGRVRPITERATRAATDAAASRASRISGPELRRQTPRLSGDMVRRWSKRTFRRRGNRVESYGNDHEAGHIIDGGRRSNRGRVLGSLKARRGMTGPTYRKLFGQRESILRHGVEAGEREL